MKSATMLLFLSVSLNLCVSTSCSSNNFPKYEQLGGLRVLGLRADLASASGQAEFSPGDSVVLTPYISDFGGAGRQLTYTASGCVDPGIGLGVTPSCAGVPGVTVLGSGNVILTGAVSYTGQANTIAVQIPSTIFTNQSAAAQYNGVNYIVTYQITAPDGTSVASFKRLPVSVSSKIKNQNPVLNSILANGAPLSTLPAGVVTLGAGYTAASIESYSIMNPDTTLQPEVEQLLTTFFVTDGTLDIGRVINDEIANYTPPGSAPTDHSAIVVEMVRDGRGGEAFFLQKLN